MELLLQAGATLGGLDEEFVQTAIRTGKSKQLWAKAGAGSLEI